MGTRGRSNGRSAGRCESGYSHRGTGFVSELWGVGASESGCWRVLGAVLSALKVIFAVLVDGSRWPVLMVRGISSGSNHSSNPEEYITVVYFCQGALKAHIGKVASLADSDCSDRISGICQSGPWSASRKRRGCAGSPRSAGFSMMYCVPAANAAVSSAVMRATTALACRSSRRCFVGTLGRPRMLFRSLTTGGPSSLDPSAAKWRVTEKVLHGGAATMARNSPRLTRCSRRLCTSSFNMSPSAPPPVSGSLSSSTGSKPNLVKNAARPSGRR